MINTEIFTHDNNTKLEGIDDSERTPCECFSRVMGYIRPIAADGVPLWNIGKVQEFRDRKYFSEKKALGKCEILAAE